MIKIRKKSDTVLPMLKTEAYYPTKHPELETKYGMLGGIDWGICPRDEFLRSLCEVWW